MKYEYEGMKYYMIERYNNLVSCENRSIGK